jgi:uncharacterized protein YneF (UPF0154 family)
MTTQHQIIAICIIATIAVPVGTFVTIKTINKLMRPPVNNLLRTHGDIELDYIEPTQPQQIYNYPDLLGQHFPTHGIISNHPVYEGSLPSYFSTGNPPSYRSGNGFYINSCLENTVNVDYISWLILFFILGFLVIKYLSQKYFKKYDKIIFSEGISIDTITFTKDYQKLLSERLDNHPNYFILFDKTYYHILNSYWTLFDIIDWLKSIEVQDYAVTFELISKTSDELIYPKIILTNEFIVNKESNPVIISSLLSNQLENIYNMFDAEYKENHYILIRYTALTASF